MQQLDKPENAGTGATEACDEGCDVALVYATFPSLEVAEAIGGALVDQRLAACVNILPGMVSIYRWQGARHRDPEVAMLIKTRRVLTGALFAEVRRRHPYENPALLEIAVGGGAAPFLAWVVAETSAMSG